MSVVVLILGQLALACAGAPLAAVLCLVVLRPAVVRSDVATDNRLRAASAVRAVRLAVSALALTAAGDLFFGGSAVVRVHDPGWQQNAALGAMALGAALGVVGIVLVLLPAPRLPRVPGHTAGAGRGRTPVTVAVTLDMTAATPPYEQVRAQLAGYIRAGALRPGDKLPVVRALAADLGVATNTIAGALLERRPD